MAGVRPPAGGQSLKQNYDLDQVQSKFGGCGYRNYLILKHDVG